MAVPHGWSNNPGTINGKLRPEAEQSTLREDKFYSTLITCNGRGKHEFWD